MTNPKRETIERSYQTSPERMWELWTTKQGIESWWGPEGFRVDVLALDLRPGGKLHYAMTAVAPEQVEFMKRAGLPLTNEAHATYRAVERPRSFSYDSLVDFVPGVAPYTIANDVELVPNGTEVKVILTMDALHDAEWTQRLIAGRKSQLDKLAEVAR
jgi:uncharacterized protein YndB with AHSA1/START domain